MALIECKNLKLSYENNLVLKGLNFSVESGDYIFIVGENGSGKSTLVRSLLGLKSPSDGEIVFGDGLKKNDIGYLPQKTQLQKDFPATVKEVVLSGTLNRKGFLSFYNKNDRFTADKNMKELGIYELRDRNFRELSGGQQQRVLLARALCAADRLLLLDEPVAGLDPLVTSELYKIIKGINDNGVTIIMVSHDVNAALKYATHILHLHEYNAFFGTKNAYQECKICRSLTEDLADASREHSCGCQNDPAPDADNSDGMSEKCTCDHNGTSSKTSKACGCEDKDNGISDSCTSGCDRAENNIAKSSAPKAKEASK